MPLARYEIRNEYSLANPDLYRAAAKDDPEGLLEGVAMAGLVGIVRQLGDLAEFAAEVFHDLHEEVLATAARGHELLIRVQQLEAELPIVEKLMCADIDQVKFSYNPGVEWHASIRNDQNHFTQGDLPRFIRNAYENCRGPPRLFLLDKFDIAGAGACLKRYTDPSFFKMEWASSELLKAEKEQQDKRARRIKKKGQRRRNGETKEASRLSQMQPRMHYAQLDVENLASTSSVHFNLDSEIRSKKASMPPVSGKSEMSDPFQASSSKPVPQYVGDNFKVSVDAYVQDVDLSSYDASSNSVKISSQEIETEGVSGKIAQTDHMDVVVQKDQKNLTLGSKAGEDAIDDVASETDHYMDALTTMDSEVETDSESKIKVEAESEFDMQLRESEASAPLSDSTSDELKASDEQSLHTEEGDVFIYPVTAKYPVTENSEPLESVEPVICVVSPQNAELTSVEEEESPLVDHSYVSPIQESSVSASFSEVKISLSPSKSNAVSGSEEYLDSGSIDHVSETPQNLDVNDHDNSQMANISETFQQLPDPAIPLTSGGQTGFPEHFGSLSSHGQVQSSELPFEGVTESMPERSMFEGSESELPFEGATESMPERNMFEGSESELTESPKEVSPRSPADSTIQSRRWANDLLDTDDDMDDMRISSGSPSSSSSTLSSPRPSMLATTVFHMHSNGKPDSVLSSQESYESSPKSPIQLELYSHSPVSPLKTASESSSSSESNIHNILPKNFIASSPTQSPRFSISEPQHSPPLPPLPPLEWRMMRRFNSTVSSSLKQMSSPPTPSGPLIPPVRPEKILQASRTFVVPSTDDWKDSPAFLAKTDNVQQGSSSFFPTFENEKETSTTTAPGRPDHGARLLVSPSNSERNIPVSPPARHDESSLDSSPREVASKAEMQKPWMTPQRLDDAVQDSRQFVPAKFERKDSLIDAIATHDRKMLKKVPEQSRSPRPVPSDDREVLLEQIRTGSFSLRRTKIEKQEAPRRTTNINVAAILEKANAIRQAFAGSDDDDYDGDAWSDT